MAIQRKTVAVVLATGLAVLIMVPTTSAQQQADQGTVLDYLAGQQRSGVAQSTTNVTWLRRSTACQNAQTRAALFGGRNCNEYTTGECFDCFNDGDRDDPDWSCSVRWSCIGGDGLGAVSALRRPAVSCAGPLSRQ